MNYIDASMLKLMIMSASANLKNSYKAVDDLNVFPVPDGDTGTNMSLTFSGATEMTVAEEFDHAGKMLSKLASASLRNARGNSGVILSLFFRGIAKAWKEQEEADCELVLKGFGRGVSEAYKAVMKPTEGTILTVMRVMVESTKEAYENGVIADMNALFAFMQAAAKETLDRTPELLPILKQAGVVDSGGYGFLCAFNGMVAALGGNPVVAVAASEKAESANTFENFNTSRRRATRHNDGSE